MYKRSWIEIDTKTIKNNYDIYKANIKSNLSVMAVVKADAYGHGDIETASILEKAGCEDFAVSNISEAIKLREGGIKGQILILGYTDPEAADKLYEYDITQALLSEEYAEKLKTCFGKYKNAADRENSGEDHPEKGVDKELKIQCLRDSVGSRTENGSDKKLKVQWAIDTGMNRIGLDGSRPEVCEEIIRDSLKNFNVTGIFTHLCVADTPSEETFTNSQIASFKKVAESIADLELPYVHCLNSAGGLWAESYGSMVRLGIILYGLKPDMANTLPEGIKPALSWKSVVSMVKKVYPGESIGYGRTFKAEKEMTVATISTGYADGFNRALSNKGRIIFNGITLPIVGRVCMDQFMVDATNAEGISQGSEVILLGEGYDADEMGKDAGTIGYEIVCDISKRVDRKYLY